MLDLLISMQCKNEEDKRFKKCGHCILMSYPNQCILAGCQSGRSGESAPNACTGITLTIVCLAAANFEGDRLNCHNCQALSQESRKNRKEPAIHACFTVLTLQSTAEQSALHRSMAWSFTFLPRACNCSIGRQMHNAWT